MFIEDIKILNRLGKQYIPDVTKPSLPGPFKGRPEISSEKINEDALVALCPTQAIGRAPISIDMGKCVMCGECSFAFPNKIKFTTDYKIATNVRERLVVKEGDLQPITLDETKIRSEIRSLFGRSLKLREISAAGSNADEAELNACGNPNFDMGRFGIEFLASPRHCDGIVITGPISENMAGPLQTCYDAVPAPKMIILVGTDAISGGIFAGSGALNRTFLDTHQVDLYVPGNPPHPLTFVNGVLELVRRKSSKVT
ncbi:MAG: NADH:ubiquinone oxidoreductase [Bacteroidetes bacterium]|nr:NADH:ubiquinone oxidoreductase [Bacteroidota bacterium]